MKKQKKGVVVLFALMCAVILSCGGCGDDNDDDSPTIPSGTANVAGIWTFAGQLTQNTCNLDAVSPIVGRITFNQSGAIVSTSTVTLGLIRDVTLDFIYAGTVTGNTVSMAARNPYVFQSGGQVINFGSGIDIQNIQNNAGTGSINLTGQCVQGCTGNCQVIWTGTWTQ